MEAFELNGQDISFKEIRQILDSPVQLSVGHAAQSKLELAHQLVATKLQQGKVLYGINTGFGKLASVKIPPDDIQRLQLRLILSHATGVGPLLEPSIVRLLSLLKIQSLLQGYSGVHPKTLERLVFFHNQEIIPCIPAKGSVGASGDLAPLAHFALPLIGEGEIHWKNKITNAGFVLEALNLKPLCLAAKEGLALLNGTQASTAIALAALVKIIHIFDMAVLAGAMSVDAAAGSDVPFDDRIHRIRRHLGQRQIAERYRKLLANSQIRQSHLGCERVQDPYSLRCQPQVMGALWDQLVFVQQQLMNEANAVTDNPLVFYAEEEILTGGNFHAEPVALVCDQMAVVLAEIGNLSERRTALLTDASQSALPAFLVKDSGLNSGFMIAHVTVSALASENKMLAHPASVDTIPTSANQEDHVSMATHAAFRLHTMADNAAHIVAIELMAAAQGIRLRRPLTSSDALEAVIQKLETVAPHYEEDRYMAHEIKQIKNWVLSGELQQLIDTQ